MGKSWEEIKGRKKQHTTQYQVVLDPEWAEQLAAANAELIITTRERDTAIELLEEDMRPEMRDTLVAQRDDAARRVDEAQAKVDELRALADDNILTFTLRGLAMWERDELLDRNRPTDEQIAEAKEHNRAVPSWNEDTYPAALVHATLVDPAWSLEDVQEMFRDTRWNIAEIRGLYDAADGVSTQRRVVDLGEG